jgi:hypothetical protein
MHYNITPAELRTFIYHIRGKAVMLDNDLAILYQVGTKRLNEAVKRNLKRFPEDFMFQLTTVEYESLRSQFATSNISRGGRRYLPYVFTEQGVTMLSCVLNSDIAIEVNIQIMRAFVQIRHLGLTVVDIRKKINGMEKKYDHNFKIVFDVLRQLLNPPEEPQKPNRRIGFLPKKD